MGNYLVDFHGPHDHQMLLAQAAHVQILDRLVDFGDSQNTYARSYAQYKSQQIKLQELQNLSSSRERELDLLGHQVKELEQVPLEDAVYRRVSYRANTD